MKAEHAFVSSFGLSSLAGAIALALAGGSAAQAPDAALEEITVTGTRIRRTDGMAEPVPVTTLTAEELAAVRARQHDRRAARRPTAVLPDEHGAARRPGTVRQRRRQLS